MKSTRLSVLLLLPALLTLSCGPAIPPPASTKEASAAVHRPLTIPSEITADNLARWEAELFLMDPEHPQRLELRDQLLMYYMNLFSSLSEDDEDARLDAFHNALALHERADFRNLRIGAAMEPMALWLVSRFEPRGKEALVLAGLWILSVIHPERPEYNEQYLSLMDWSQSVRDTVRDPIERYDSIATVYDDLARMVPHREILDRLSEALALRQRAVIEFMQFFSTMGEGFSPYLFQSVISRGGIGREFLQAFFLGDYLVESLERMEELEVQDGIDDELLQVVKQIRDGQDVAYNYHQLAQEFGPANPAAGLRACLIAHRLAPSDPRYALCVGRFFSNMERQSAAMDFYARGIAGTDDDEMRMQGMELMRESLFRLHTQETRAGMDAALAVAVSAVRDVVAAGSSDPRVGIVASGLMEMVATVEYDDGFIVDAGAHFQEASALWPASATPVTRTAEIQFAVRNYDEAIRILTAALMAPEPVGGNFVDFWKAMMLEQRGDCYRETGRIDKAQADYRSALAAWDVAEYPLEQTGAIAIRRGIIRHRLGEDRTDEFFREAIRVNPERRSTYAEIISFLVVEGNLEQAAVYYRLAFNQDQLESMWKIYFAIWVEALSLRSAGRSFDLARGYLDKTSGKSWQERLAMYFTGRMDVATLRSHARNRGQEVEADYYEALQHLAARRPETAAPLLQKVIDSDLVAFFEYRMARELLRELNGKTGGGQ